MRDARRSLFKAFLEHLDLAVNSGAVNGHLDYKQFRERHRPHIHPPGKTLFVTFRLAGSIPQAIVHEYKARKEWLHNELKRVRELAETAEVLAHLKRIEQFQRDWFMKFENLLHRAENGPVWLKEECAAAKMIENLHRLDGDAYRLEAYCVMSNHVHLVFTPFLVESELEENFDQEGHVIFVGEHPGLSRIMHSLKGRSARECNLALTRTGQFWEHESFDHVVRRGKLARTIRYVLNNPVKAGMVKDWRDWRWSHCRNELVDQL